jgi:hypothetical protein
MGREGQDGQDGQGGAGWGKEAGDRGLLERDLHNADMGSDKQEKGSSREDRIAGRRK